VSLNSLIEPLEKALQIAEPARSYDFRLFFQLIVLRDSPNDSPQELRNLLEKIKSEPSLDIFQNAYQDIQHVDFYFLLSWMISRGQQVGPQQVIVDLNKYLNSETIEITRYLLVKGLKINSVATIADFTIIPWEQIPASDIKYLYSVRKGLEILNPDAAICIKKIIPIRHKNDMSNFFQLEFADSYEPAYDLLKCCTILKNIGIIDLGSWETAPEWAPWKAKEVSFYKGIRQININNEFDEIDINSLLKLHFNWIKLDLETKNHLRLSIDRLNKSLLNSYSAVDTSIDIGIAFESIFLKARVKESESIGLQIRLRAAKYLGNSLEERQLIVKQVKDVYNLRSMAVHSGTFAYDKKWKDSSKAYDALNTGRLILCKAITSFIENGLPDWDLLDLS
jgi:hypothetical protein